MKKILIFNLIIAFFFSSCTKEAGEGGSSSIQGTVYKLEVTQDHNTGQWDTTYEFYTEKDIYIIYSSDENDIYDDSFETHWNGMYKFDYLRQGSYTIFTYADSTHEENVNGNIISEDYEYPIFRHIEITKNHETYILDDFLIVK